MAFASRSQMRAQMAQGKGTDTVTSSEVTLMSMKSANKSLVGAVSPKGKGGPTTNIKQVKTPPSGGRSTKLTGKV